MVKEAFRVRRRRSHQELNALVMRSYMQHLLASLWKRRAAVLLILGIFAVSMVLLQYHTVHEDPDGTIVRNKFSGQRTLRTFDSRSNSSDRFVQQQKLAQPGPHTNLDGSDELRANEGKHRVQHSAQDGGVSDNKPSRGIGKGSVAARQRNANDLNPDDNDVNDEYVIPKAKKPPGGYQRNNDNGLDGKIQMEIRPPLIPDNYQKPVENTGALNPIYNNVGLVPGSYGNGHVPSPAATPYIPLRRLVHLDFKGAPPKISYLQKLVPVLKQLGATGLLLEYEDMFPFDGPLKHIAAHNHYSRSEIRSLLQLARNNGLDVIPLVQTFGHLEFVLKLEPFKQLREVPTIPQALCPSKNESMKLVELMIDQVLSMHPETRWVHIGCDEVFQLASCPICSQRPRDDVFLDHVARVASYVREKHKKIPIIWDDLLRNSLSPEKIRQYRIGDLVEPMLWTYVEDVYRFISPNVWTLYAEVFPYIWTASAFKGAFGETLTVPDVKRHLENNLAWLEVMNRESSRFKEVRGIAITGWQRYDHFATLCELLPAAIPSLAIDLLATSRGYFNQSWQSDLYEALQCMKSQKYTSFVNLETDPHLWSKMSWCFFPGVSFFKVTERLAGVRRAVSEFLNAETVNKAWLTEYSVRHNFSSVTRIESSMQEFVRYYYDVETLIKQSRDALREVFDEYTVAEWIEQNVYPMLRKLELLQRAAESLRKANTWPVRPFNTLPDLQRFNIGIPDDNS